MFELPEILTLARQIDETLAGKIIEHGQLGNSPHKFVWYNRAPEEFTALTRGKTLGRARVQGRWMSIALEPGLRLLFGECGGRLAYHPAGAALPAKYHLRLDFTDGSAFTAMTQMWGAMELYEDGKEQERQYIQGMRPVPGDAAFTFTYFNALIDELLSGEKRSVKSLLTQDQLIPGLGNSCAQDILFRAGLHPRRALADLNAGMRRDLYDAIFDVTTAIIAAGGRYDELDLFGRPGGYARLMDSKRAGQPCPACGATVQKIQYLGGACYFCPRCQV